MTNSFTPRPRTMLPGLWVNSLDHRLKVLQELRFFMETMGKNFWPLVEAGPLWSEHDGMVYLYIIGQSELRSSFVCIRRLSRSAHLYWYLLRQKWHPTKLWEQDLRFVAWGDCVLYVVYCVLCSAGFLCISNSMFSSNFTRHLRKVYIGGCINQFSRGKLY